VVALNEAVRIEPKVSDTNLSTKKETSYSTMRRATILYTKKATSNRVRNHLAKRDLGKSAN